MTISKASRVDLKERLNKGQSRSEWLRSAMVNKHLLSNRLLKSMTDIPNGLNAQTIDCWIYGSTKTATWEHWIAVKSAIKKYNPQDILVNERRVNLEETFNGQSRIEWLRSAMADKKVGSLALLTSILDKPEKLKSGRIESWLHGSTKSAPWEHWISVKKAVRAYKNYYENRIDLKETFNGQSRGKWLKSTMADKKIGSIALLKTMNAPPEGLKYKTIDTWLHAGARTAPWEHWVAVKNAVKAYEPK